MRWRICSSIWDTRTASSASDWALADSVPAVAKSNMTAAGTVDFRIYFMTITAATLARPQRRHGFCVWSSKAVKLRLGDAALRIMPNDDYRCGTAATGYPDTAPAVMTVTARRFCDQHCSASHS